MTHAAVRSTRHIGAPMSAAGRSSTTYLGPDGAVVIAVRSAGVACPAEISTAVDEAIERYLPDLLQVDLAQVTELDVTCLAVLLSSWRNARAVGTQLEFRNADAFVLDLGHTRAFRS